MVMFNDVNKSIFIDINNNIVYIYTFYFLQIVGFNVYVSPLNFLNDIVGTVPFTLLTTDVLNISSRYLIATCSPNKIPWIASER